MGNNLLTSRLNNQKARYLAKKCSIDPSKIVRIDSSTFLVPSETKKEVLYEVNMDLRLCECYMGQLKGPCKHKSIVSTTQNIPSFDVVPTENPEMRALFMYLGTGKKQNPNWFKPLSSAATEQVEPTGILDKIEDIAQPLVEEEEDIQVDAIDDIDEGED